MRAEGMAERTILERARIVSQTARLNGVSADAMTTRQLVGYLASLHTAGTRQTYFGALRAWHRWLIEQRLRGDDPMISMRRPKVPRRRPRPVATSHLQLLLDSDIRGRTRMAVLLCSYQGLRVHEAAKVRGEDVDLLAETIHVVGKGGVDDWLPLHPAVAAEAGQFPRRGFWFPSYEHPERPVRRESLSAVISRAMKRAGVPGSAHCLRHWYATELLRAGVSDRVVQTMLRHASLATLAIYTQINEDQQRAALATLPLPHPRVANRRTVPST